MDWVLRKTQIIYDADYSETYWLLFEHGSIKKPVAVITDLEFKELVKQYETQKTWNGHKG